jgi:hypothetical protein
MASSEPFLKSLACVTLFKFNVKIALFAIFSEQILKKMVIEQKNCQK